MFEESDGGLGDVSISLRLFGKRSFVSKNLETKPFLTSTKFDTPETPKQIIVIYTCISLKRRRLNPEELYLMISYLNWPLVYP